MFSLLFFKKLFCALLKWLHNFKGKHFKKCLWLEFYWVLKLNSNLFLIRFHQTFRDQSHSHMHHKGTSQLQLQKAPHRIHHRLNQHGHHLKPLKLKHHSLHPLIISRLHQLKVFIKLFLSLYSHFHFHKALFLPLYPHTNTNNFLSI